MKIPYYQLSRKMFIWFYMFIFYPLIVWGCYCTILDIPEKWTYFLTAILLRSCLFHTKVLRISKSNIIQSEHLEYPKKKQHPPPAIIAAPGCRQRTEGFVGPCVGVKHLQAPIIRSPQLGNIKDLGQHPWNCSKWRNMAHTVKYLDGFLKVKGT